MANKTKRALCSESARKYLLERSAERYSVGGILQRTGLDVQTFPSPDGKKANLFASLGPKDIGGLMLAGHTAIGQDLIG